MSVDSALRKTQDRILRHLKKNEINKASVTAYELFDNYDEAVENGLENQVMQSAQRFSTRLLDLTSKLASAGNEYGFLTTCDIICLNNTRARKESPSQQLKSQAQTLYSRRLADKPVKQGFHVIKDALNTLASKVRRALIDGYFRTDRYPPDNEKTPDLGRLYAAFAQILIREFENAYAETPAQKQELPWLLNKAREDAFRIVMDQAQNAVARNDYTAAFQKFQQASAITHVDYSGLCRKPREEFARVARFYEQFIEPNLHCVKANERLHKPFERANATTEQGRAA